MHIDHYSFGEIVVNGEKYTSDVIIYPDRVDAPWWRREGHELQKADLAGIINTRPDILIIGTGNMGVMHVPESTIRYLESFGIQVHAVKTGKAVELFNNQPGEKKVAGAFHLTC